MICLLLLLGGVLAVLNGSIGTALVLWLLVFPAIFLTF